MAETINGTKAVVWGIPSGLGFTGTGIGTFEPQSITFSAEADEVEVKNARGQCITKVYYNQRQLLRMEVIPTDSTIALAKTQSILPEPGAIITAADSATPDDDPEIAATNAGKYIFVRGEKQKSNTDVTKLTFELLQYVENDVAVLVS